MELSVLNETDYERFCRFEKEYSENGNVRYSKYVTPETFRSFLDRLVKDAKGIALEPDRAMQIAWWLRDGADELLGAIRFRPKLDDGLYREAGHVGYDVRPSARNRGIATQMLLLVLDKAKRLGYERLILTCNTENDASSKVIEKCGGQLDSIVFSSAKGHYLKRFRVPTGIDLNGKNGLSGTRCFLKETNEEDLECLRSLWADGRVMQWVGFPKGLAYRSSEMKEWLGSLKKRACRHFSVYSLEHVFCGEVYYAIDSLHRRAGLDIKLRPEFQGKGFAADALSTLIDFCYKNEPSVREVWTEPSSENNSACKLYQKCGLLPKERPADMEAGESYWALEWERWQPRV